MFEQKTVKAKTTRPAPVQGKRPQPQTSARVLAEIKQEMIAKRAHEIWERKGRPHGKCEENWLEAEAELRAACKVAG